VAAAGPDDDGLHPGQRGRPGGRGHDRASRWPAERGAKSPGSRPWRVAITYDALSVAPIRPARRWSGSPSAWPNQHRGQLRHLQVLQRGQLQAGRYGCGGGPDHGVLRRHEGSPCWPSRVRRPTTQDSSTGGGTVQAKPGPTPRSAARPAAWSELLRGRQRLPGDRREIQSTTWNCGTRNWAPVRQRHRGPANMRKIKVRDHVLPGRHPAAGHGPVGHEGRAALRRRQHERQHGGGRGPVGGIRNPGRRQRMGPKEITIQAWPTPPAATISCSWAKRKTTTTEQ
jgi:hypothetical protein